MPNTYRHEKTSHNKLAWAVTLTASLFFFYEFIQMNFFNSINTQLRETFQLDAVQIGQLFSMYFYANALCLFPVGNLLDRFSTKKMLTFAVSICTLGTFIFTIANVFWVAALGRFLVGCGASFCFLSCIRLASRWFPPHRMAFVTGVIVTMAMLGGLVAQTPFALLVSYLGSWRQALMINTGLGVVILLAVLFVVQDRPPDSHEEAKADHQHLKELGLWRCIKLAALNPQNWFGGLYTSLMNLPVFILGGLWGILYLTNVHHITMAEASYATTMFFVGVIFGSLIYGWISDHIERRVFPMIVGAIISLVVMGILMYVPGLSLWSLILLFFLVGLVTSSQVLTYPTIAELNPIYLTSTAVSIDSVCIMVSGFVVPPFFGWLMEGTGVHAVVNGLTIYTAQDFNRAMLVMPIAFIIALVIAFFIRETYCRSQA
ncbi:MFS transporter [Aquicella lusitana]|uniref:Lysosomal dipeptide transporter MFSD1 n=1 Tax=Aquicella lusitana TaxID=254246 RepID=A0A370GGP0_9COXI|nr:MFS transporter [Aquicella lusitana]RDI42406.1 sugar phosphate permease [Aquicella lusitana]VVC74132.1 D-galactonate transporter [Aquicella lusitana]